jgi:hypothetical protein
MSNGWYATYNDFGATWGKKIGAVGIAIYQSLASRAWDGQCFPSYQTIAEDTGVSRPTAIKYIKKLQETGLIEVQPRHNRRGDPTSNLYTLANLPLLKKKTEEQAKVTSQAAVIDTSGMSEAEIAESVRKSHFVSRPKKKPATLPPVVSVAPDEQQLVVPKVVITTEDTVSAPDERVEEPVQIAAPVAAVVVAPSPTIATPATAATTRGETLNFGLLDKKDEIAARHLLKNVPNKQEVLDELNKAIREQRIQTTAIQYLAGLTKKVAQGEFVPSAHKKTEDELLTEKKQQAAKREQIARQAIADCPYCNDNGYLVFSAIDKVDFKSVICTHNEKSAEFVKKLKEQEIEAEVITYFGKEKSKVVNMGNSAVQLVREAMSSASKRKNSPNPAATASVQPTATTVAPISPVEPDVEPESATATESEPTGYGFKPIGEVIETTLAKKKAQTEEQPPEAVELPEIDDPVIEESSPPPILCSTDKEPFKTKVVEKLAIVQAKIDDLYANEPLIACEMDVRQYLSLQIKSKIARARALTRDNRIIGESNQAATNTLLEQLEQAVAKFRTVSHVREILTSVEKVIQMLSPMRADDPQRLLDANQEYKVLTHALEAVKKLNAKWRDVEENHADPAERQMARSWRIQTGRFRYFLIIEDKQPGITLPEMNALTPEEYRYTPSELKRTMESLEFNRLEREAAAKKAQ